MTLKSVCKGTLMKGREPVAMVVCFGEYFEIDDLFVSTLLLASK